MKKAAAAIWPRGSPSLRAAQASTSASADQAATSAGPSIASASPSAASAVPTATINAAISRLMRPPYAGTPPPM